MLYAKVKEAPTSSIFPIASQAVGVYVEQLWLIRKTVMGKSFTMLGGETRNLVGIT